MNVHRDFTTDERRMLIAHIIARQITELALRGVIKPNTSPSAPPNLSQTADKPALRP